MASRCTVDSRVWRIGRRWAYGAGVSTTGTAVFSSSRSVRDETKFGQAVAEGLQLDSGLEDGTVQQATALAEVLDTGRQ